MESDIEQELDIYEVERVCEAAEALFKEWGISPTVYVPDPALRALRNALWPSK